MPTPLLLHSFMFFLLFLPTLTKTNAGKKQCTEHEKSLLLELRNQLVFNSSQSAILAEWNQSVDCCRWKGVECDGRGHVVVLEINNEGISGGLNESSSLFGLEYLEDLDLSTNVLNESQFLREFDKLTRLTSLDLSYCSLTGYFPVTIFQLPTLQRLDLSFNPSLGGSIPQFSRNNSFTTMVLTDSNISGSLPTDSFSNLENLSYLDLSGCRFSGTVPLTLSNLMIRV